MINNNTLQEENQRNPFVALCEYASQYNWCWKLVCTTCGHSDFRIAFSKIVREQHPDDESFWPNGKEGGSLYKELDDYNEFFTNNLSFKTQAKLANIVAQAKLTDIQAVAKYPDWLGYIGLVINYAVSRESRSVLANALLPQFIALLPDDKEIRDYLFEKVSNHEFLSISDLSRIESKRVDLKNAPAPLILDHI